KPNEKKGMGIDSLPQDIKGSRWLSGNHLGMLGNCESFPDETTVNEYKLLELSDLFIQYEGNAAELEEALHKQAADLLNLGKVHEAFCTLLSFNN
ncbi:MAG: flavin reductase family protein, partial [Bacteroidota bacterium]